MATSIGVKLGIDGEAEYRKQLNNIITTTKTLDKQLAEVASSFDDEADAMEKNAAETELLQKKAEQLAQEVEMMQQMVDAAAEKFGENSTECQKWEASLASAQTELNKTNSEIEAHNEAAEQMNSALGQLTSEISSQESELESLREQYVNAVLEFGDTSDEAQALAGQISTLSEELQNNQNRLDGAKGSLQNVEQASADAGAAADDLSEKEGAVGDTVTQLAGMFDSSFGSIVGTIANANVAGLMMEIAEKVIGVVQNLWEMQLEFDEAQANIAVMTGAIGDDLDDMKDRALEAWAAVADKDLEEETFSAIVGNLNTRLGATGDTLENLAVHFGVYAATIGTDGPKAVNDLVDVMQKWGLTSEDNATNVRIINELMDKLANAQSLADVSVEELAKALIDQSGTFQELGMGVSDAIGFMVAYRDAGGSVSEITRAMDSTLNKLTGETDDLSGAWNEIVGVLENSDSKMGALNTTVGDTGKTVQDVLGAKLAGRIYDTFNSAGVNVDGFTKKITNSAGTMTKMYQNSRTDMDKMSQWFKDNVSKKFLGDWTNTTDQAAQAGDNLVQDFDANAKQFGFITSDMAANAKTNATEAADTVKTKAVEANDSVDFNYSMIKETVKQPAPLGLIDSLEDAKTATSTAVDYIYDKYDWLRTKVSNNPIKMSVKAPVIEYSTSGNGSVFAPQVMREMEFARGYDHAMLLSAPTIFGSMGNNLLVGGDGAGNEVVVGERHLLEMFKSAVRSAGGGGTINVVVNGAEGQSVDALADAVIDRIQQEILNEEAVYA